MTGECNREPGDRLKIQSAGKNTQPIELQRWSDDDLPLLKKLLGDPEMMKYLGGPESEEQIVQRNQRYARHPETGTAHMFKIVWGPASEAVGSIGFWERTWRDQLIYETGWSVLPAYQGRGIATKAAEAVVARARVAQRHQFISFIRSLQCRMPLRTRSVASWGSR